MFNLLTTEHRKEIKKEYKLRLFTLVSVFLFATGIIATVLLLPSLLAANFKLGNLEKELALLENETPELKNVQELENFAEETNNKLRILSSQEILPTPLAVWQEVLTYRPSGVKIKSFSFNRKKEVAEVKIGGTAISRDSLTAFAKSLEDHSSFENVNLPVSNLAPDRNLNFSISFSVNPRTF